MYIYDFKIQNSNENEMSLILSGPWTVACAKLSNNADDRKSGRAVRHGRKRVGGEPVNIFFKYLCPPTNPPTCRNTFSRS